VSLKLFLQKINQGFFLRALAFLLALALLSSCTDTGCIDADDFGEYESQTIEIPANSAQENCNYDYGQDLTSPDQGAGIKNCLISGNKTVTDEAGTEQQSTSGCNGLADAKFRNICINDCVQLCNSNSSSSSSSAEPNWISTDKKVSGKNVGVTIRPGSQVMIRAVGSVVLGESVQYPDIFVQATSPTAHSKDNSWDDIFFDVRKNQSMFLKFSGTWTDGADAPDASIDVGGGSVAMGGANDHRIINGAKRLVAYLMPHPPGYGFDTTAATEKAGSQHVPLLPDPEVWQCAYTGGNKLESNCSNSVAGYSGNGYPGVNNTLANATFPITSTYKSTILSTYGGMIRWNADGLLAESDDPFVTASVICNGLSGSCTNIGNVPGNYGRIVGNLSSSGIEITNDNQEAYKISLRSLTGNANCNITISSLTVSNAASTAIYDIANVAISNTSWTSQDITLEPKHKLIIAQNTQNYPGGANCGLSIGAKFTKYHDIQIDQSGFVKFTMLRGSGVCNIRGRIINPTASHFDIDTGYTADFYEYDAFNAVTSNDPLNSLSVTATPPLGAIVYSGKVFVRKGQVIRFSPESWNGEWTTSSGSSRKCGIGMAMVIEPRPALLCRGKADDVINNLDCIPEYSGGLLIGCQPVASNCDSPSSGSFCPSQCRRPITCTSNGTASNNYQRSGCSYGAQPVGCAYATGFTDATCLSCAAEMTAAATNAAKISVNSIDQCYDLENYKGKVANIPSSNAQTKLSVDAFLADTARAKNLVKLGTFSNRYGNLDNFNSTGSTEPANGNIIYQLKAPLIFTDSGRLKLFVLDGKDFNGINGLNQQYNNNSIPGASYSGSNGFKISTSGTLEFSNGTWLQARICQESSNTSVICKNSNPVRLNNQPNLIEITAPSATSPAGAAPILTGSNYKFNDYGNILRTSASGLTGDCDLDNHGVDSYAGAVYYCHTHQYFNKTQMGEKSEAEASAINDEIGRLRITFKILDPEVGNCTLSTANDGLLVENPFYNGSSAGTCDSHATPAEIPGDGSVSPNNTCRKQYYCANKYYNNSGKYYVNIKVKSPTNGTISNIIGSVVNPIVEIMDGKKDNPSTVENEATIGQAERVYKLLISDTRYQAILTMALVTMFTFYGFGYLIGVVEMNHADIIGRIIKIGLIYLFVGETGWEWFNKIVVKFFKDSTDYLAFMMASSFDNSPELTNAITNGDYYDKSILFSSVDRVFSLFFASAVQKKVSALLFASIFGWAYLFIIYSSFMLYVYSVANAVLLYLTAQVFISILFVLGPIFFVFTLFSQTKEMFDNWLKQLIGFSLQQIFLLTTLAFFNMLMYEVIKMSLGYKICWDEVWTINIITRITLLSFWTVASLPPRTNAHSEVGNIGNPEGIPSLFTILFIWIIASLMNKFIGFMTDLAAGIAGGLKASELGKGVADFAKSMKKQAGAYVTKLGDATGLQPVRRLDKFLFDSGKLAEEARTKKRKQNSMDLNNKNAMAKAGDKAVSNFKTNNAKELMGLTQAEQRAKLNQIRDSAMTKEGKKLGLNEEQIKKLKDDTGLKYVGSNAFGALAQAVRQKAMKGGSLSNSSSLNNRELQTAFSHKEGQEALANMSSTERKQFLEAAKQNKVEVKEGASRFRKIAAVASLGTSELAMAAGRGAKSAVGSLKDAAKHFHDSDYNEAAEELKKEGVITKHTKGFGWSRDGAEKKLINERKKANLESKKLNKTNKSGAIAQLESEAQYLQDDQDRSESDDGAIKKGAGAVGSYLARATGVGKYWNKKDEAKAGKKDHKKKGVAAQAGEVHDQLEDLDESRKNAVTALGEAQTEMEGMDGYSEMVELGEKIDDGAASKGEKARYERLKKTIDSTEAGLNAKEAKTAIHQIDAQKKIMEQKAKELQKMATGLGIAAVPGNTSDDDDSNA
jgi:type IV secretory pathway VirB6-like protein